MLTTHQHRTFVLTLVAGLVVMAMAVPPAAARAETAPAFIVDVKADGSADVTVRSTFDLTTDSEQEAFQTLLDDDEAQQDATDRFLDRMRAVASDAENATGREMRVTGASIDLQQSDDGDTGIVVLSATWEGLARVDGDTLVITEPFASGFVPDRPLVLMAPDGYQVTSATPEPRNTGDGSATWDAGTDLSGFAIELQPAATPTPTEPPADDEPAQTDGQPGFGWLVALLAVLGSAALVGRRRARL